MRYNEFAKILAEAVEAKDRPEPVPVNKAEVEDVLRRNGHEDLITKGNLIGVVTQLPDGAKGGEFRSAVLKDVLATLQKYLPDASPTYSRAAKSSLGGVVFGDGSPVQVVIKDAGKQGSKSSGVGNEVEIAAFLQSMVEKYGTINVTFFDHTGKKMSIEGVNKVVQSGTDVKNRKKADIVLLSSGGRLPVSIKKINAETWESADTIFGARARKIIDKLVSQGVVKLIPHPDGVSRTLSKEIVIEPTEEDAMSAIFGSDINPDGGIVIQDFQPKHYKQEDNNISIECHAVIREKADIPTSHLMVWLLRNNPGRLSKTLGIRGIRPMASVLNRAIGKSGTKDVILVDQHGNVVENPNLKR